MIAKAIRYALTRMKKMRVDNGILELDNGSRRTAERPMRCVVRDKPLPHSLRNRPIATAVRLR